MRFANETQVPATEYMFTQPMVSQASIHVGCRLTPYRTPTDVFAHDMWTSVVAACQSGKWQNGSAYAFLPAISRFERYLEADQKHGLDSRSHLRLVGSSIDIDKLVEGHHPIDRHLARQP